MERCAVIVNVRDRFLCLAECLDTLIAETPEPNDLIVVVGGASDRSRDDWLRRFGDRARFIFAPHFLNQTQARNIGLRAATTRFAVVMDDDVFVRSGWLKGLLDCQRETGAVMVVPLILETESRIHTSGNALYITYENGPGFGHKELSIIAFTDDDVLPAPDWIAQLAAAIDRWSAHGVGGRILPRWETSPPLWLTDSPYLCNRLAIMDCESSRLLALPVEAQPQVWGANMAFRRELLDSVGGFDPQLGGLGKKLFTGEETDLIKRALGLGLKIAYDPGSPSSTASVLTGCGRPIFADWSSIVPRAKRAGDPLRDGHFSGRRCGHTGEPSRTSGNGWAGCCSGGRGPSISNSPHFGRPESFRVTGKRVADRGASLNPGPMRHPGFDATPLAS